MIDLTELKRLNSLRTQGRWSPAIGFTEDDGCSYSTLLPTGDDTKPMTGVDRNFIAYMANNAGALIEEIERKGRQIDALLREIEKTKGFWTADQLRLEAAERVVEAARELSNDSRCNGTPGRDAIIKLNRAMDAYDKEVGR